MKKLLFILLLIIPFLGFSQFEAGEYINADTIKIAGDPLIYPAEAVGENYYRNGRDPSDSLDLVNLRTLFRRLADLDSLGLLVTDLVSGRQYINTGETQIFFPSAFDSNNVVVIPFVRRISDDAVIDYLINDVDSLGFDIVVWEDNVKLYYVASQNISHSSDIFGEPIYSADSSYIKSNIRDWINSLAKTIDENDTTFWGRPETDPFYSDDSLFLNRTAMDYVSDSSQILHWADSLPTSGAGIATIYDIKNMIDGSGTASFVPKFSDSNTLTNSVFKDDGTIATLEQNSVQPFTSVLSGAVDNTLYLKTGNAGFGTIAPAGTIHSYRANANNLNYYDSYSVTSTDRPIIYMRKSNSTSLDTTVNGSYLGHIYFQGVNTSNAHALGGYIFAQQNGTAGTYVPTDISILTYSSTARNNNQLYLHNSGKTGFNTSSPDQTVDINCGTTGGLQLSYNDANGSAVNKVVYGVTSSGDATITPSGGDVVISGRITTTQITAALTDNTPTDAEIDAATSLTPSTAGAGWQCTIKDNNGSGLLYKVESDGTDWYYIALTKAL